MKLNTVNKETADPNTEREEVWMTPPFNVSETEDSFQVTAHVPGVAKEGVELIVDNDNLVITGRKAWKKPESWVLLGQESAPNDYRLSVELDHRVNTDTVKAELAQGILKVTLPKSEASKPRKIEIQG